MSIVREFERAFNRRDVSVLVACFTPDGTYHDTFFGGHAGADQLRAMFERMFREGRDYAWTMETVVETDECAAAEWTFAYEKRGGRIAAYRESFDMGAALLQLGFSPEATVKTIRRHRL